MTKTKSKVAVLGASGFVGSRFIELALLRDDLEVVPVVRSFAGAARLARFGVDCQIADVDRQAEVRRAIEGCTAVINVTAGDPEKFLPQFTRIYEACEDASVPILVHTSSAVVFREDADPQASYRAASIDGHWNPYAREKARIEAYIDARRPAASPNVVVLRPGLVWGPRSPWVVGPLMALSTGTAYLVGDGDGICNLIFVDNFIESALAAAIHPSPSSGFFNVSDDERMTWRQYYTALAGIAGADLTQMVHFDDQPFRPTLANRLEAFKRTRGFQLAKGSLSRETRRQVKQMLKQLRSAVTPAGVGRPQPRITRDIWTLQRTRYQLPTERFVECFGHRNRHQFNPSLERTAAWARYAGFIDEASPMFR